MDRPPSQRTRRLKRATAGVITLGVSGLVVASLAMWPRIEVQWQLRQLRSDDPAVRLRALSELTGRDEHDAALDELRRCVAEGRHRTWAFIRLDEAAENARPHLVRLAQTHADLEVRREALQRLPDPPSGEAASDALVLEAALEDPDPTVRRIAARRLAYHHLALPALRWLKTRQRQTPMGSWAGSDAFSADATTGLVLLAFGHSGHTHRWGSFKRSVSSGLRYLKKRQNPDGTFGPKLGRDDLYDLVLPVHAMAHLYANSRDFLLERSVLSGKQALAVRQRPDGGWARREGEASDPLLTAHCLMALNVGRSLGLTASDEVLDAGLTFLHERIGAPKGAPDPLAPAAMHVVQALCGGTPSLAATTSLGAVADIGPGLVAELSAARRGDHWAGDDSVYGELGGDTAVTAARVAGIQLVLSGFPDDPKISHDPQTPGGERPAVQFGY